MVFRTDDRTELRESFSESIIKDIIAFANTAGGTIYLGVGEAGGAVSLDNPEQIALRISNICRDSVRPDVSMSVSVSVTEVEAKPVIMIDVEQGTGRPYFLASAGLTPRGVHVRKAGSSAPASISEIRRMISETDGDAFETARSIDQNLTFEFAGKAFAEAGIPFDMENQKALGLINSDGLYTNLALLLSDQCPQVIRAAVFGGRTPERMLDRKEFCGSLLMQLYEAYGYLDSHNQARPAVEGGSGIGTRDYKDAAIREALVNSVVHRDYSNPACNLVTMYADRLEFVSYGGLAGDVLPGDVLNGLSVCRNRNLAGIFRRLKLIDGLGTGLRKIRDAYAGKDRDAEFIATPNSFRAVLPNMNCLTDAATDDKVGREEEMVLRLIDDDGSVSRNTVQTKLGISASSAVRLLNGMKDFGLIETIGKGKNLRYVMRQPEI